MADSRRLRGPAPSGPVSSLCLSSTQQAEQGGSPRDLLALCLGPTPDLEGPWPSPSFNEQRNPTFSRALQPSPRSTFHRRLPLLICTLRHPPQPSHLTPGEREVRRRPWDCTSGQSTELGPDSPSSDSHPPKGLLAPYSVVTRPQDPPKNQQLEAQLQSLQSGLGRASPLCPAPPQSVRYCPKRMAASPPQQASISHPYSLRS